MENIIFEKVILPLVVIAIPALLGWIVSLLKKADRDRKQQRAEQQAHNELSVEADIAIMYDRLNHLSEKSVEEECCPLKTRRNMSIMFDVYERLGGNHGLGVQVNEALKLPERKQS